MSKCQQEKNQKCQHLFVFSPQHIQVHRLAQKSNLIMGSYVVNVNLYNEQHIMCLLTEKEESDMERQKQDIILQNPITSQVVDIFLCILRNCIEKIWDSFIPQNNKAIYIASIIQENINQIQHQRHLYLGTLPFKML